MYGGMERDASISPAPQSRQLKRRFWAYDLPNGTETFATASTDLMYAGDGNPK
jgi:hypothetical protein